VNLARQLPFDFSPRAALGLDDFMVVPGNADAVAWLDRPVDWPNGMLAIYGPVGCGKTHLAHVWQSMSGAQIYDAADLNEETAFQWIEKQPVSPAIIIEGADRSVDEAALFHLYNMIVQAKGSLLLTGVDAPARWPVKLPDLASRLGAVTAVELAPPDDDLFAALLIKQFSDRQINVASDVVVYLVARLERSFEMARRIVRDLDRAALAGQRNVTKPLARQVLQQLEQEQDI
jgi:DnaA regulatory inactivator Hda